MTMLILALWAAAVAFANADYLVTAFVLAAASIAVSIFQVRRVRHLMED